MRINMERNQQHLNGQFEKKVFQGEDLSCVHVSDCIFLGCSFITPDLKKTRLQNVSFEGCKLSGVDFTLCDPTFFSISFTNCHLDGCNFSQLPCKKISFKNCRVLNCHFIECDLREGDFQGADLGGTLFHQANMEGANFCKAINYQIDPMTNRVKGAKFSRLEAVRLLEGLGVKIE